MAKNVVIREVEYDSVPSVTIPLANGSGDAVFTDTSDATLSSASQMLDGVTAYDGNGNKVTGSITGRTASDLTASGDTVTVPAGNYASQVTKSIASGSVTAPSTISGTSASITTGTNTLTLSKSVSVTPNVTTAGYISSGTAGNASVSLTASVTTRGASTITPTTSNQTIASGTYTTGVITIAGDTDLVAANIVSGKTIFNVAGTAKIPVISQNSTTKVLSIS